eukprot:CAMPEP_0114593208 /NCGR_PEP_ID=MMETSP0125-20121206/14841_1 /TAXON_ID=485358 ORGANISM="Aristerostoma sp., Strain ATCC 50986" /NCGR_SAMPLE_ID=MMETSP0125 /ASSEMBLY_ACC=CAM_ASM_000245 /LENGTH=186 /DNA_ID=CAMNT_0001792235 /DNA_START=5750 /DNA_END=6310 /DNA_ORIENTATION=-
MVLVMKQTFVNVQLAANTTQNGTCDDTDFCQCSTSLEYADYCSNYQTEIIEIKGEILEEIEEAINEIGSQVDREFSLDTIQSLSEHSQLNSDETILKTADILDLLLNSSIYSNPLNGDEESKVSKTIDQMIQYASDTNCKAEGNIVTMLKENMEDYLDVLASNFLKRTVPGESPSIQINNHYNIYL